MDEYIDRETLKERFKKRIKWLEKDVHDQYSFGLFHGCEYDANLINDPPAADVAPVRHGRWICIRKGYEEYECSVCHGMDSNCSDYYADHFVTEQEYCPFCGAKMDGGAD